MATTSEASRLQWKAGAMRFTWITVGLLALFTCTACGVGVDDLPGQQAAYGAASEQGEQALATGPEGCPPPTGDGVPGVESNGGGAVNPGISNLPTDPLPWQGPNPVNGVDPMANPMDERVPVPGPGGRPTGP